LMQDVEIVAVVHILLDTAREAASSIQLTDGVAGLLGAWGSFIDVYAPGCLDVQLERFVQTDADRDSLLALASRARARVVQFGAAVPADYLDRIVDAPGVLEFGDWPVPGVLAAFDKFTGVLAPP
jgi:hypothetical protein